MTICTMSKSNGDRTSRFFITDGHGYHRGRWLSDLPDQWVATSVTLPMRVVPRPGCEDGVVDTVEKYIVVFHQHDTQITVEDALREVGASLEFPDPSRHDRSNY